MTDGLAKLTGAHGANPLGSLSADIGNAGLVTAAWQMFALLMYIYAGDFLLIAPINFWHRGRRAADYGLTRAGRSWTSLIGIGLAACALSMWPVMTVDLINSIHPSQTLAWRQAFFSMSWMRWQFWLFAGAASYAVIPVVEELFYRGYCQRRLAEDWGDGPAIVGGACLFTLSHYQYQIPNLYNAGMIVGLFLSAIGIGIVFAWTRSLVPGIIAHAIIDVPATTPWAAARVAVMVAAAAVLWRKGLPIAKQVFASATAAACWTLAAIEAAYSLIAFRIGALTYVAAGMVALAVVLEALERRRNRVAQGAMS